MMRAATLAMALALTLGACSTPSSKSDVQIAVPIPAQWSLPASAGNAAATPLGQWWLRFNDPLLAALIQQSLAANTRIQVAQAALQQARALRDAGAAALLPALAGSASAQKSRTGEQTNNGFKVGLDASWELDVFGANRSGLRAQDSTVQASAAVLGDVQVSIAAEVGLAYMALRSAQERIAIARRNLASQQETLQLTQWRLQAGLVTALEVNQAVAAAEQTYAQIPALQTAIAQNSHALATLTGRPPAALTATLGQTHPLPQAPDALALSIPTDTLRQRSDVRASEYQVAAALARVDQADAARAPSFKLGGTLGLSALTLGALTDGASIVASLLASVLLPVFDGGAGDAQLRSQQAALDQSKATYKGTILTALTDVEDALVALQSDKERLLRFENAAQAASSAALLARQRYSSGLVDFQTVLETQRTQLTTQDSEAVARATVSADHVRLYKALGGGWIPNPTLADAPNP
jgi:NodT family efflux transporter outer membrane factor (OMF) lipoprotein